MIKVKGILFLILLFVTFILIPIYAFSDNQNNDARIIEDTIKRNENISGDLEQKDIENIKDIAIFSKGLIDISYLSKFRNLERLDLSYNNIEDISPLSALTNLKYLRIDGNKVKDISAIANLKHLEKLWVNSNRIENIGCLEKLDSLKELSFDNNNVSDISPLKSLKNLCLLSGANNKIKDINVFSHLPNINSLFLDGNPIKDYSALIEKYDYIKCDVSFDKVDKKESVLPDKYISTLDLPGDINKINAFGLAHNNDIILTGNGKSVDGVEWDLSSNPANYNVTYDGEKFVKIEGNIFSYSFDGEKWINSRITNDMTNITINKIIKGNKKYIAIGGKKKNNMPWHGIIATSTNGVNWNIFESKDIPDFNDVAWNGKEYIVIGYQSALKSLDGQKWVRFDVDKDSPSLRLINWNGKQFIIIGYSRNEGYISYLSQDGKHWSKVNIISDKNLDYHLSDIIWDGKKYIVVGNKFG